MWIYVNLFANRDYFPVFLRISLRHSLCVTMPRPVISTGIEAHNGHSYIYIYIILVKLFQRIYNTHFNFWRKKKTYHRNLKSENMCSLRSVYGYSLKLISLKMEWFKHAMWLPSHHQQRCFVCIGWKKKFGAIFGVTAYFNMSNKKVGRLFAYCPKSPKSSNVVFIHERSFESKKKKTRWRFIHQ